MSTDAQHSVQAAPHAISARTMDKVLRDMIDARTTGVSHAMQLVARHSSLVTTFRGMIDIKGNGPMNTYWLEQR